MSEDEKEEEEVEKEERQVKPLLPSPQLVGSQDMAFSSF